jgi:tRNA nucleotidyltransferase/poly(A) polymerase
VGGSVRDLLLGRRPVDLDVAVTGDPANYAQAIADRSGQRVIAMGKPGQTVFRVTTRDGLMDVTALKNGRIEDDLRARDFTVNAMAWDLQAHMLIDPLNGQRDIAAQRIRMIAASSFENDPLRLLRTYRMAATLNFAIERETRAAVKQMALMVQKPAGERIRSELLQLLGTPDSGHLIRQMATDHLLTAIFPEMLPMRGCLQNEHHDGDVFDHTLQAYTILEDGINSADDIHPELPPRYTLKNAPVAAVLKYAMLLHDSGKPASRRRDSDGRIRFLGHADRGARIVAAISQRLRLSRLEAQQAETIIRNHLRPRELFSVNHRPNSNLSAIHRFFRESAPWSVDILVHALGDWRGKQKASTSSEDGFTAFVTELINYYFGNYRQSLAAPPLLRGHDLIRHFGVKPGPVIGSLLDQVEEARLDGSLTTHEEALEFVHRKLSE